MAQVALPVMDIILGGVIHRPPAATVRLLPPPPAPWPRLEVVLGKTIQGLFHITHLKKKKNTVQPVARGPPPEAPSTTQNQKQPCSIFVSIQGLLIPPFHGRRRSPRPQAQPPSRKEIWDSIQCLLRRVTPAVCRPLTLPLAARIARDPTAAAAVFVAGSVVAACRSYLQVVPYSNRVHAIFHSTHEEDQSREVEEFEFRHFKKTKALCPRHYQSVRVRHLASEIVGAIHRGLAIKSKHAAALARVLPAPHTRHLDGLDWDVIVTRDKECNAYVYPSSGKIVILEGLLRRLETDAEIAAVIAHEVGHVVQRYTGEWLSTPPFSQTASLSRRLEAEADYIGIMLLAAAGYDPQAAVKVCEKFAAAERNKDYCGWRNDDDRYSTHPSEEKRAQFLSQRKVMEEALRLYGEVTGNQERDKVSA